jgi:branched-chain amino acid transport system substrate-binding protein
MIETRSGRRFTPAWATLALVLGITMVIASLSIDPPKKETIAAAGPGDPQALAAGDQPTSGADPTATGGTSTGGSSGSTGATKAGTSTKSAGPSKQAASGKATACAAGQNGGSTDVGVTGSSIKLGATVVQTGIGASFLGDVRFAMNAVTAKTNQAGGICGRRISLVLKDDGWDYNRGGDYIHNLVEGDKVFALAVVPSSEGLLNASKAGYLDQHKVPVVGSDGMLISQYEDPYIWPVAASTISTMHIMVKQAFDAGQRDFAIVYESTYHFGIEGAFAFNAAVKRVTGSDVQGYVNPLQDPQCKDRFCGISAGQSSYSGNIQQFNSACTSSSAHKGCDFIALLLEPATATTWMKGGGLAQQQIRLAGPQPLFTYDFGNACGAPCDQIWLWTGYLPPIGDYLGRPAVSTYVNDIKAASSTADYNNSFVEGGYVGMELVVKALQAVGPNLTRDGLKAALDNMEFDSGLTAAPLKWRQGNHFANVHMQAYSMQFKGGFNGWRDERTSLDDPWVGQDSGH